MTNPVWKHYINNQIEEWLDWVKNIHLRSHLELFEKFIDLNPHYVPTRDSKDSEVKLVEKLMWNPNYINSLSDKGLQVWVSATFADFVDELRPYGGRFNEISKICDFIEGRLMWFERTYAFVRADIVNYLRDLGREI